MHQAHFAHPKNAWKAFRDSEFRFPVTIWLYSRIFYYGCAFVISQVMHFEFSLQIFSHWDVGWYQTIVEQGYMHDLYSSGPEVGRANWAFFPVLPYLVRIVSGLSHVNVLLVAYVITNISLAVGLTYLYKYLIRDYSTLLARLTVAFIAFSPVNVYFTSFYTESLFFALLTAMIYYARAHRWVLAGIIGAFLSGTRNTGIFMIAIYIFEFLRSPDVRISMLQRRKFLAGLMIFPFGLIAFMIHLKVVADDFLAFYHVQAGWIIPGATYRAFFGSAIKHPTWFGTFNVCLLATTTLTSMYFLWKKKFVEFLTLIPITLISLVTFRIQYRFYFSIFPIYLLAAILTQNKGWALRLLFLIEIVLLFFSIKMWITGHGLT